MERKEFQLKEIEAVPLSPLSPLETIKKDEESLRKLDSFRKEETTGKRTDSIKIEDFSKKQISLRNEGSLKKNESLKKEDSLSKLDSLPKQESFRKMDSLKKEFRKVGTLKLDTLGDQCPQNQNHNIFTLDKIQWEPTELEGKSFYIFGPKNKFRVFLQKVISHRYFDRFIILTIIGSCILLLFRDPFVDHDSIDYQMLVQSDRIVLSVYFSEILINCIVYGFLFNGPQSFLRSFWKIFDFCLFLLTTIGTLDESLRFSKINLKPFRALRFVKIVAAVPALRKSFRILLQSVPELISVCLYYFLNLLFFGIISMKYFKNSFYSCVTVDKEIVKLIINKWDCFDYGGDWVNADTNFDNIIFAISTLFQLSTTEGWMKIM